MSVVPMLAGVGLMMVCCSSSSVASMMMGGETTEETKPVETGPPCEKDKSFDAQQERYHVRVLTRLNLKPLHGGVPISIVVYPFLVTTPPQMGVYHTPSTN